MWYSLVRHSLRPPLVTAAKQRINLSGIATLPGNESLAHYLAAHPSVKPDDFVLYPTFLSQAEQAGILSAALKRLDTVYPLKRAQRLARKDTRASSNTFYPPRGYPFEAGHHDGVIHNFREMAVNSWEDCSHEAAMALMRLYELADHHHDWTRLYQTDIKKLTCPSNLLTHVLHLAPDGHILPHVDNPEASGSVIVGASLGDQRVMELLPPEDGPGSVKRIRVHIPPGSVYIQRYSDFFFL